MIDRLFIRNVSLQAWVIPANGEAVEVFSWRQGPVRTLKVLVSPKISDSSVDRFSLKRPILAICDAAGPGPQFHSVFFISLKTGEQVLCVFIYCICLFHILRCRNVNSLSRKIKISLKWLVLLVAKKNCTLTILTFPFS